MNKIFNYCILSLLSVLTLTLGSCTEEYDYVKQKAKGQQNRRCNDEQNQEHPEGQTPRAPGVGFGCAHRNNLLLKWMEGWVQRVSEPVSAGREKT